MSKAFFIDKDGTLVNYKTLSDEEDHNAILTDEVLYDDVVEGLKHLNDKGYKLIVISNQPWISRGIVKHEEVEDLFRELINNLKDEGVFIEDYFFCPHQSSDNCDCRKPKPGMIFEAAKKHDIDLENSYIIGDSHKDILAGKEAGLKTIFVLTGELDKLPEGIESDYTLKNLNSVKDII